MTMSTFQKKAWGAIFLLIFAGLAYGGYSLTVGLVVPQEYDFPNNRPPGKGVTGLLKLGTDSFDVMISFTGSGFVPPEISIAAGTRVRFVNDSSEEFWPASGIHPTHTLYPEKSANDCLGSSFDACTGLPKGGFFDYTFFYPGTWSFHDHLHPEYTGRIIVNK